MLGSSYCTDYEYCIIIVIHWGPTPLDTYVPTLPLYSTGLQGRMPGGGAGSLKAVASVGKRPRGDEMGKKIEIRKERDKTGDGKLQKSGDGEKKKEEAVEVDKLQSASDDHE